MIDKPLPKHSIHISLLIPSSTLTLKVPMGEQYEHSELKLLSKFSTSFMANLAVLLVLSPSKGTCKVVPLSASEKVSSSNLFPIH